MNPLWLLRNARNAWSHRTDLISFLLQLSWPYSNKLPEWFFDKENIIRFHYPNPIGYITIKGRANCKSDVFVFSEVFQHQYYNLGLTNFPETILDLGANAGFTAIYFHKCFPKAQIACVEPIPRNVESLRVNLALNQVCAQIFPAAIAVEDGSLLMEISKMDGWHKAVILNTSVDEIAETLLVDAFTVPTICEKLGWHHIDLLKVDIEGYERILFSGDCSWLKRVNAMCIEWHDNSARESLSRLAAQYGFNEPCRLPGIWLLDRAKV